MALFILEGPGLTNAVRAGGQNAWIHLLFSGVIGCLLFTVYYRISKLHQHQGLPDILKNCFGKWLGSFLIVVYGGFFLFRSIMVGNIMSNKAQETLMHGAPHRLVIILLLGAIMFGSLYGLRAIGRSAEILFFIIIVCTILFCVSASSPKVFKLDNLRPLLEYGIQDLKENVFRDLVFFYGDLIVFLAMLQYVSKKQKKDILKRSYFAIIIGTLILIVISVVTVAILGSSLTQSFTTPFYHAMQVAGASGLLNRLDPLAIFIIVVSAYFRIIVYFYAAILAIQSLSQKFNFKWTLWFVSIGIFLASPYIKIGVHFQYQTVPFKILPVFSLALPSLMWIVSEIKNYRKAKNLALTQKSIFQETRP